MKPLKFLVTALAISGVWTAMCSMARADSLSSAVLCPKDSFYFNKPGGNRTNLSWHFDDEVPGGAVIVHFLNDKIILGNGLQGSAPASFDQLQKYEPILADLRAAAVAERKVSIKWLEATKQVHEIQILWKIPC